MKFLLGIILVFTAVYSLDSYADEKPANANCQVKLVKEAGMMEIAFDTVDPNECLRNADSETQATYKTNDQEQSRGGTGPKE